MRALFSVASVAACAYGARLGSRKQASKSVITRFIDETPVLNYHLAYSGTASLMESKAGNLEGDWIVVMNSKATDKDLKALCKISGCKRTGHPSKQGVPYFEVRGTEEELTSIVRAAKGAIQFIEPNSEAKMIPIFETMSSASWGLDRIGAPARANAGEGVHVFVLDTGVRATHNDFGGRVIPTLDMSGDTLKECKGDLSCAKDRQGHGTHCAGSAAGLTYGVAPKASIHSIKVLGDQGSGSWSWSYDALDWLATEGERPAVASMSLGGSGTLAAMKTAVDASVDAGVVVVVAAGNENSNACNFSPAFVPSAITVGSTTKGDVRSSFSNYGRCVDIWAPGSNITSAAHSSDSGSKSLSGTSMACPHVSGAVALILETNSDFTSAQVIQKMKDDAESGAINGLRSGDTNKLLYVGADGAPAPAPSPPAACNPEFSYGPDRGGDCKCWSGLSCHTDGNYLCKYTSGGKSSMWFSAKCGPSCVCK